MAFGQCHWLILHSTECDRQIQISFVNLNFLYFKLFLVCPIRRWNPAFLITDRHRKKNLKLKPHRWKHSRTKRLSAKSACCTIRKMGSLEIVVQSLYGSLKSTMFSLISILKCKSTKIMMMNITGSQAGSNIGKHW